MATVTANPARVRPDATVNLVFSGPAGVAVAWSVTGTGELSDESVMTDERGFAWAKYTPGTPGDVVTVSVTYGA